MKKKNGRGGARRGAGRPPKIGEPVLLIQQNITSNNGGLRILDGLPFRPRRSFIIDYVPESSERGNHAHRKCHQIIFCVAGIFQVEVKSPSQHWTWNFSSGNCCLVPAMHWITLRNFNSDAVCFVLASECYDESDVICDWKEFVKVS